MKIELLKKSDGYWLHLDNGTLKGGIRIDSRGSIICDLLDEVVVLGEITQSGGNENSQILDELDDLVAWTRMKQPKAATNMSVLDSIEKINDIIDRHRHSNAVIGD